MFTINKMDGGIRNNSLLISAAGFFLSFFIYSAGK